jgi:hypothetical protein
MTDTHTAETPIEPVEIAAPDAAAIEAPASAESSEPAAERALPFEIEHAIGPLRQAVLGHLLDTQEQGPQSVAAILASMPASTSRANAESAIRRELVQGRIERVAPGTYRLAPAPPPEPAKPAPPPEPEMERDGRTTEDQAHLADRERKNAAARQAAADAELRDRLIEACRHGSHHNYTPALVADDLRPIRMLIELGVSIDRIVLAVRWRTENEGLTTWRDEKLLRKALELFARFDILPTLLKATSKTPGKPAERAEPSAATPQPAAPADASTLPQANGSAPSGDDAAVGPMAAALLRQYGRPGIEAVVAQAGEGDASKPPETTAPAPPQPDDHHLEGREAILQAFNRNRTPPRPAAPQPRPTRPQAQTAKPWFAGGEAQPETSDETWRFLLAGFAAGNAPWGRMYGPAPETPGCKVPGRILKEFGFEPID